MAAEFDEREATKSDVNEDEEKAHGSDDDERPNSAKKHKHKHSKKHKHKHKKRKHKHKSPKRSRSRSSTRSRSNSPDVSRTTDKLGSLKSNSNGVELSSDNAKGSSESGKDLTGMSEDSHFEKTCLDVEEEFAFKLRKSRSGSRSVSPLSSKRSKVKKTMSMSPRYPQSENNLAEESPLGLGGGTLLESKSPLDTSTRSRSRSQSKPHSDLEEGESELPAMKTKNTPGSPAMSRSHSKSQSPEDGKSRSRSSSCLRKKSKKSNISSSRSRSCSRSPRKRGSSSHRSKSRGRSKSPSYRDRRKNDSSSRKKYRSKSPKRGRSRSPRKGRSRSPRKRRSRSPGKGRSRSPGKGRSSSHQKGRSRSPREGRSRSPRKGRSRSPRKRRSRSPRKGRSRSPGKGRSRSPREGRSRSPRKGRSRSPRKRRSRSPRKGRSRSPRRWRSRSPKRKSSYKRYRSRSRSRRRSRSKSYTSRRRQSRSHSRSPKRSRSKSVDNDKYDVTAVIVEKPRVNEIVGRAPTIDPGNKRSLEKLTEFCKKLVEARGIETPGNEGEENPEEDDTTAPISHPFLVAPKRDITIPQVIYPVRPPLPLFNSNKPLTEQFPVSCGTKHHEKEHEITSEETILDVNGTAAEPRHVFQQPQHQEKLDISGLVVKRMEAQRKLQINPNDVDAMLVLQELEMKLNNWCQSNVKPGQFTGQLAKTMMPKEKFNSRYQAWARKDMFHNLNPVTGGIGMKLLQKMGWQPGQNLGKRGEGMAEPLALTVKVDRKGLTSISEKPVGKKAGNKPVVMDLQGKHPISLLQEFCARKKWQIPEFTLIFDEGPPHSKQFLFKVAVNGYEYQNPVVSGNKKHAKALAAVAALKGLGLIPVDAEF